MKKYFRVTNIDKTLKFHHTEQNIATNETFIIFMLDLTKIFELLLTEIKTFRQAEEISCCIIISWPLFIHYEIHTS